MSNTNNGLTGFWKGTLAFAALVYISALLIAFIWFGCKTLFWAIDLNNFEQYQTAFEIVVQKTWAEAITATIAAVVAFVIGDKAKQAYVCRVQAKEREKHVKNILANGKGDHIDVLLRKIDQLK